ncbi:MAG: ferric-dicitrate binding protein FerR (iron transport regulator) [Marinoscillum sp.]|jgi:ferric-dicitrate binding protein FerR (iron transport regulator)
MKSNHNDIPNIESLIAHFNGVSTAGQQAEINGWIANSEENHTLYVQLKTVWADTGNLKSLDLKGLTTYDSDKAWQKVSSHKRTNKGQFFNIYPRRIAVAAAVIIGIFTVVLWNQPEGQLIASADQPSENLLADSSMVALNVGSELIVTKSFNSTERRVKLKGEAFFEVTPDKEKPFIIEADQAIIKVVGTSFDVKMDEKTVSVLVETGNVLFGKKGKLLSLNPGERGIYHKDTQGLELITEYVSNGEDQFWRTHTLHFNGDHLPTIVRILTEVYGKVIIIDNESLKRCRLNVTFENDSLENILNIMSLTLGLEVIEEDDKIILKGKGCQEDLN